MDLPRNSLSSRWPGISEKRPQFRDSPIDRVVFGRDIPLIRIDCPLSMVYGLLPYRWCDYLAARPGDRVVGDPAAPVYQEVGAACQRTSANRA